MRERERERGGGGELESGSVGKERRIILSSSLPQELNPKVHQHLCTYLQHHTVWKKLDFWKTALYSAVQAELVRIYSEMDFSPKRKSPSKSTQRVTTTGVRSRPEEQSEKG